MDPINNKTLILYYYDSNSFGLSSFCLTFEVVDSLMRDGLFFIILLGINLLILILLKTTTKRCCTFNLNGNNRVLLKISQNAERKKMIMIIGAGLNYMIGHFPYFIFTTLYNFNDHNIYCIYNYIYFLYSLSYADGIFFYFFFNNIFKRFSIGLIPFLPNRNNIW
jgi:hypothetical protein